MGGRNLLLRNDKNKALIEKRMPEKLAISDYLLGVNDFSRQGSLRFKEKESNHFIVSKEKDSVPDLMFLNKIEDLAYNIDVIKNEQLTDLFSPGSSLGGARPKACLIDNDNNLLIAKFSHKHDKFDIPKMEYIVNMLAKKCGINRALIFLYTKFNYMYLIAYND